MAGNRAHAKSVGYIARRPLAGALVGAVLLAVVAGPADAAVDYPTNLDPGYTPVPTQVHTVSATTGTGEDQKCWFKTVVLFDKSYATDVQDMPTELYPGVDHPLSGEATVQWPDSSQAVSWSLSNTVAGPSWMPNQWEDFGDQLALTTVWGNHLWDGPDAPTYPTFPDWHSEDGCAAKLPALIAYEEAIASHTTVWFVGANTAPDADFTWAVADHAVTFTNTSHDDQDASLAASWDFGDGSSSTDPNPSHTYAHAGVYTVTLTVTDGGGASASISHTVAVGVFVVNSTGDDPASDPTLGCDTGGTVGADPECTLRAAIEASNARGGAIVRFDIAGTPLIALGSDLPALTGVVTVDGSTQPGGPVEVAGGDTATLTIGAGTATVTGLALHGGVAAVAVTDGSGHQISGNLLGLDRAGQPTDDTAAGVSIYGGSHAVVTQNVIVGSEVGVLAGGVGVDGITKNHIGVSESGTALGAPDAGILLINAKAAVTDNTVRSTDYGIVAVGEDAGGTAITGNRVGTAGSVDFDDVGIGIIVEGAPDATVSSNTVAADGWGGILVSGSVQATYDPGSGVTLNSPNGEQLDTPTTGTGITVAGNTVRTVGGSGILAWSDADALSVSDNVVTAAPVAGISVGGGADVTVASNTLGSADAVLAGGGIGLVETGAASATDNTVFAAKEGIFVRGDGPAATVAGNRVTLGDGGTSAGIHVSGSRPGTVVSDNTIAGAGAAGIDVASDGASITGNSVRRSVDGILTTGDDVTIEDNAVGSPSDHEAGNAGNGIHLAAGGGDVTGNVVVDSGGAGIIVDADVVATLTGNRVWRSTGPAIIAPHAAPGLDAAIISDTDATRRTTLVVSGLPGEIGTLEVFANDSCDDGEAQYALDITRQTAVGDSMRIIQFTGGHDNFTITYTDATGSTSALSACRSRTDYPDADGDGSVDPLDSLIGADGDSSQAVLATTNEKLLVVGITASDSESAHLEKVAIVDDPAPSSHPDGWELAYGAISFRVAGLNPGGHAQVMLTTVNPSEPLQGVAYWKYGPASPGASPSWYDFTYDPATNIGARAGSADVPGLGLRVTYTLDLADGARGDADGAANGTITDPGGPVFLAVADDEPDSLGGTGANSAILLLVASIMALGGALARGYGRRLTRRP